MSLQLLCLLVTVASKHVTASSDDVMALAASPTDDPLAHLTSLTNDLSSQLTQLTAEVSALRANVSHKGAELGSLTTRYWATNGLLRNTSTLERVKSRALSHLDTLVRHNVPTFNNRLGRLEKGVGISVHFKQDALVINQTATPGTWQHLKFDSAIEYGGHNYNMSSGSFIVPATGNYVLSLTVERNDPQQDDCVEAVMMRNGRTWLGVASACPDGYSSATNLVTSWLVKGDEVYVRTMHSERLFGFVHTTFTLFKLTPH